jgi:hypothetical protein
MAPLSISVKTRTAKTWGSVDGRGNANALKKRSEGKFDHPSVLPEPADEWWWASMADSLRQEHTRAGQRHQFEIPTGRVEHRAILNVNN